MLGICILLPPEPFIGRDFITNSLAAQSQEIYAQ